MSLDCARSHISKTGLGSIIAVAALEILSFGQLCDLVGHYIVLLVLGIAGNLEDNVGKLSCNLAGLVAKIYLFAVVDGATGCCSFCWFQN